MFDMSRNYMPYPHGSILQDVLMRMRAEGTNGSRFGLVGCRDILVSENRTNSIIAREFGLSQIIGDQPDYNADKDHPIEYDDEAVELSVQERGNDYYRRLEDIDYRWIERYARAVIIGFRRNRGGMSQEKKDTYEVGYMTDLETGESQLATDFELVERRYSVEEQLDAAMKLPYIIKALQQGSEKYGMHLLSFVIAKAALLSQGGSNNFSASDFVKQGVYKVNARGDIERACTITDNNDTHSQYGFRYVMKWICGDFPENRFYKLASELVYIAEILGVDLAKEDATKYTRKVVENAACSYLATNKEYIEDRGYGDPRIEELLKEENLFKAVRSFEFEDEVESSVEFSVKEKADLVGMLVSDLNQLSSLDEKKNPKLEREWGTERMQVVDAFLQLFTQGRHSIADYEVHKGLLWIPGKQTYATQEGGKLTDEPMYQHMRGVFTVSGQFVFLMSDLNCSRLAYVSLKKAIIAMKAGVKAGVEYVSISSR